MGSRTAMSLIRLDVYASSQLYNWISVEIYDFDRAKLIHAFERTAQTIVSGTGLF